MANGVQALNELLAKCPSLTAEYAPRLFMTNPHVETIFASFFRSKPRPDYRRELLQMPDGGTVALDWLGEKPDEVAKSVP
eukprot:scaffold5638_cov52-Prasinocladus_malaysianus.AAC.1